MEGIFPSCFVDIILCRTSILHNYEKVQFGCALHYCINILSGKALYEFECDFWEKGEPHIWRINNCFGGISI